MSCNWLVYVVIRFEFLVGRAVQAQVLWMEVVNNNEMLVFLRNFVRVIA